MKLPHPVGLDNALIFEWDLGSRLPLHHYSKWDDAHCALTMIAELDYPPGDTALLPLLDQVYDWLLSDQRSMSVSARAEKQSPVRWCASIEGNAIWYSLKLGLADDR